MAKSDDTPVENEEIQEEIVEESVDSSPEVSVDSTEKPATVEIEVCGRCGCAHRMARTGYDGCGRVIVKQVCRNCGRKWVPQQKIEENWS